MRGISSLLSSGRFVIAKEAKAAVAVGKIELGWQDRDAVYVNGNAFHEVKRITPLNVSERALHQQLQADGMLADTDRDQLTVRRRRNGHQQRVLALRPEVLGLEEEAGPRVQIVEGVREDSVLSTATSLNVGGDWGRP